MNTLIIDDHLVQLTSNLRKELHDTPELSGEEFKTRHHLITFLEEHTSVEIHDFGSWFYAVHRAPNAQETIALRADHDAIRHPNGHAFHGCGHDGHSAILAGLALHIEQTPIDRNVVYLFQPSEENGLGAKECLNLFSLEKIDRIYGMHNFPTFELGKIITRAGTIMCSSVGMSITFTGRQTHAATPEHGINPAYAIAKLTTLLEPLSEFKGYQAFAWQGESFSSMVLATIVSSQVGQTNHFGISPDNGKLQLTLRAENHHDLQKLIRLIEEQIKLLTNETNLTVQIEFIDDFVETANSADDVELFASALDKANLAHSILPEPFRPSEDFGHYLLAKPGVFFGIGSGLNTAPLHDIAYEFPDEMIPYGIQAFGALLLN